MLGMLIKHYFFDHISKGEVRLRFLSRQQFSETGGVLVLRIVDHLISIPASYMRASGCEVGNRSYGKQDKACVEGGYISFWRVAADDERSASTR